MSRIRRIRPHWQSAWRPLTAGTVFLFPGQGTVLPGFLTDVKNLPAVRTRMALADRLAKEQATASLSDYSFAPENLDSDELAETANFALFSAQVALCEAFVENGTRPAAMTAHSFGEFAMLVCAGVLSFEQVFDYLKFRESILPPPNERGYLLALHSPVAAHSDALARSGATLTHQNSPSENVFALPWDRLLDLESELHQREARFTRLSIPQPFHSELLGDLTHKMREYLEKHRLNYHSPRVPFFSSVVHEWVTAKNFSIALIKEILSLQLVTPVNFMGQIKAVESLATSYVELGVRPLLSHFVNEIAKVRNMKVRRPMELNQPHNPAISTRAVIPRGRLMETIQQALEKITGYRLESISLEDRFQEDLGLDSIKTTEVMVEVFERLEAPPLSPWRLQGVKSLQELIALIESSEPDQALTVKEFSKSSQFEAYTDSWKIATLTSSGPFVHDYLGFDTGRAELPSLATVPEGGRVILRFASELWNDFRLHDPVQILKWFREELIAKELRLVLLFHGAKTPIVPALIGLVKSLRKEGLFKSIKLVHVASSYSKADAFFLAQREAHIPDAIEVAYADGVRSIAELTKVAFFPNQTATPRRILAFGGHSGITHSLLRSLTSSPPIHIDLVGRSSPDSPTVKAALESLRVSGSQVNYHSVDISNEDQFKAWISSLPQLKYDLLINGVGAERSQLFTEKSQSDWDFELKPKWQGTLNLTAHLPRLTIGHFVHFSSVIAREGNAGQSVYAFASAWSADVVSSYCRAERVSIVEWPPWDGIGMTSHRGVLERLRLAQVSLIPERIAHELFEKILYSSPSRSACYRVTDLQDQFLFELPLIDEAGFPGSLGKPAFSISPGTFLSLLIPQEDECLGSHRYEGRYVLPAAAGIVLMATAGRFLLKQPVSLMDFSVAGPLQTPLLPLLLELKCRGGGKAGTVVLGNAWRAQLAASNAWPDTWTSGETYEASPGPYYDKRRLFHTGNFRVLSEILRGSLDGWRARGNTKPLTGFPFSDKESRLVTLLDGAFQLLAWSAFQQTGHWHLPTGAALITLSAEPWGHSADMPFEVTSRLVGSSTKDNVSDFDVFLGEMRVIAVRGAKMSVVTARPGFNA